MCVVDLGWDFSRGSLLWFDHLFCHSSTGKFLENFNRQVSLADNATASLLTPHGRNDSSSNLRSSLMDDAYVYDDSGGGGINGSGSSSGSKGDNSVRLNTTWTTNELHA